MNREEWTADFCNLLTLNQVCYCGHSKDWHNTNKNNCLLCIIDVAIYKKCNEYQMMSIQEQIAFAHYVYDYELQRMPQSNNNK